jgi:hypothetical protein
LKVYESYEVFHCSIASVQLYHNTFDVMHCSRNLCNYSVLQLRSFPKKDLVKDRRYISRLRPFLAEIRNCLSNLKKKQTKKPRDVCETFMPSLDIHYRVHKPFGHAWKLQIIIPNSILICPTSAKKLNGNCKLLEFFKVQGP